MLGEDPRENRIAEWFRGLTMGVRIQIVLFSVVGIVLVAVGSIDHRLPIERKAEA